MKSLPSRLAASSASTRVEAPTSSMCTAHLRSTMTRLTKQSLKSVEIVLFTLEEVLQSTSPSLALPKCVAWNQHAFEHWRSSVLPPLMHTAKRRPLGNKRCTLATAQPLCADSRFRLNAV